MLYKCYNNLISQTVLPSARPMTSVFVDSLRSIESFEGHVQGQRLIV